MNELYRRLYECTEFAKDCDRADIANAFLSDSPYAIWMACKAAGQTENAEWVGALIKCAISTFESNNPDINSIAIWALAKIGGKQVDAFWATASRSSIENERRAAADLLGEIGDPRNLDTLARLLEDESDTVSEWAALSLSKLGPVAIETLVGSLRKTRSIRQSIICVDAIAKVDPQKMREWVQPVLNAKSDTIKEQVNKAIMSLEKLRNTPSV